MKAKQLGLLLVAAVLLGGLGWYVRSRDAVTLEESKMRMGDPLLPGLDINAVSTLRFQEGAETLHVERKGEAWTVRERHGYPANFGTLADFLRKLADLKITQPVDVGPSRHAALKLTSPPDGEGVLVELLGADEKPLKRFLVGGETSRTEDPSGFGGGAVGRYIRVLSEGGSAEGEIAKVSDSMSSAKPNAADWINKDFFKVELPVAVHVKPADGSPALLLERPDEFGDWALMDVKEGESLDRTKVGTYNSLLSFPSFNDVAAESEAEAMGLVNPTIATVRTAKGFEYGIRIGTPQAGDVYPIQIAVTGNFPESREAAADESEEDATRLNSEFEADLKARREKLAKEQALTGWIYLVNKWAIDALLKPRADLLAAPEGSPGAAGAAGDDGIEEFDLNSLPEGFQGLESLLPDSGAFPKN